MIKLSWTIVFFILTTWAYFEGSYNKENKIITACQEYGSFKTTQQDKILCVFKDKNDPPLTYVPKKQRT